MNIRLHVHPIYIPAEYRAFELPETHNNFNTDLETLENSLAELISFIAERFDFGDEEIENDFDFFNDIYFELFGNPYIPTFGGKYMFANSRERKLGMQNVSKAINYIAATIEPLHGNREYERNFYKILIRYKRICNALYERAEHIDKFFNK